MLKTRVIKVALNKTAFSSVSSKLFFSLQQRLQKPPQSMLRRKGVETHSIVKSLGKFFGSSDEFDTDNEPKKKKRFENLNGTNMRNNEFFEVINSYKSSISDSFNLLLEYNKKKILSIVINDIDYVTLLKEFTAHSQKIELKDPFDLMLLQEYGKLNDSQKKDNEELRELIMTCISVNLNTLATELPKSVTSSNNTTIFKRKEKENTINKSFSELNSNLEHPIETEEKIDFDKNELSQEEKALFELLYETKTYKDSNYEVAFKVKNITALTQYNITKPDFKYHKEYLEMYSKVIEDGIHSTKIAYVTNSSSSSPSLKEGEHVAEISNNETEADYVELPSECKFRFHPNVDSHSEKVSLDYDSNDFRKIVVPQKAEPPQLVQNLDIIVKNPGIYPLESVRQMNNYLNMSNFDSLPSPDEIEFDNFEKYMNPFEDKSLKDTVKKYGCKYASSTSNISPLLSHFFYKLTNFKSPHFYNLSEAYEREPLKFMMFQRKPTQILLKREENFYTINKCSIFEPINEIVLLKMGKYMEKIFTTEPEEFNNRYLKKKLKKNNIRMELETDYFNFINYDKIMLRSQIDCAGFDSQNKPIFFEIKTRAVAPIRYDVLNYNKYLDYEIRTLNGKHSSYEREFYDLIRGAFLKYIFQLKIGGMDGALVSYHNTKKIFGFEYITLADMERRIFGNTDFSNIIFKASLKMIQETLDFIIRDFPNEKNIIIGFFANEWKGTLDIFVELYNLENYSDRQNFTYKELCDYFYLTGYRPKVYKYSLLATPIINNVSTTFSPILFENYDNYSVKYEIKYLGEPGFDEYMKFVNEAAYVTQSLNLENQFSGSWSLSYG